MRKSQIKNLACCHCGNDLTLKNKAAARYEKDIIKEGVLNCTGCRREYMIRGCIPRFVDSDNYACGFGFQWNKHAKVQYDSYNGLTLTKDRFFNSTHFSTNLNGELILEAGSGAGRFTEIAAETGAMVVSFDYSHAVEANYAMNGAKENVLIVQADIYNMPFKKRYFDKIFCFGVLQHTPDVKKAFMQLPLFLTQGGELAIDVYKKTFIATWLSTKYYVRQLTRNIEPKRLYAMIQKYINFMWPIALLFARNRRFGHAINSRLLIAEYSRYGFSEDIRKEMAYLDSFDMLAPKYDSPQTIGTVQTWFKDAGLTDIIVSYGYNGIIGRGKYPHK